MAKAPSSSEEGVGGGAVPRRTLLARAAEMRKNPPEPEKRLWRHIRKSQLAGEKFRRQAVIGYRIVDFFCPQKGLVVEIDGDLHDAEKDRVADRRMQREHGFATVRYSNDDVMTNLEGVLEHLVATLENAPERWVGSDCTTPRPPPLKRRGSCVAEAIRAAAAKLDATSDTARLDAELLMAHALGMARSDMLLRAMGDAVPEGFDRLVERRTACEPVAYITGVEEFYGRDFAVSPDVLIPRSDSEALIVAAIEHVSQPARILDLGTGSGALLITALLELGGGIGLGLDASEAALRIAESNARALGFGEEQAQFFRRDWHEEGWTDRLGQFDLILCNPPYVEDGADLDPDVREYEPASALFAGSDGLDDYRILIPRIRSLMGEGAVAIFEIGHTQAEPVSEIARENGFAVELRRDLANRPRALILT